MASRRGSILLVVIGFVLGGCDWFLDATDSGGDSTPRYSVTYQPNGAGEGAVPVDGTQYEAGDTVSVLGNSGALARGGYSFVGWNTDSEGDGTAYTTGATFAMPDADVALYATWSSNPTFTVTYDGTESDSGSVPVDTVNYEEGATVTVLGNTGSLARTGYSFVAWNSEADGNGTAYSAGATFAMPASNQTLYATWEALFGSSIERVSIAANGDEGNGESTRPALSGDGRYVAFDSEATDLVSGDANGTVDVFVYDRQSNTVERVSVAGNGDEADDGSTRPALSEDGRYVAFHSFATNLVASDTNTSPDVFVYDRQADTIERVSVNDGGTEGNAISTDASISGDGRYVAFESAATNLIPGDTNGRTDIFVFDRDTDTIERVSVGSGGTEANNNNSAASISSDGRYVAFQSTATNLVPGDTNGRTDVFVFDRDTDTIERVSVDASGTEANNNSSAPTISSDGRYVAFQSDASNLVAGDTNGRRDIFVFDRQSDTIERVSVLSDGTEGDDGSEEPSITTDGRYVAFESSASNLVSGDLNSSSDVFVYDRQTDTFERVSVAADGSEGDSTSNAPSMSADGSQVVFTSDATNLVTGDTNGVTDIFVVPLF